MENTKYIKQQGRAGEYGKLRKRTGRRRAANKRARAASKKELR